MTSPNVDTHPIKWLVIWLADQAGSIPPCEKEGMERSMTDISDLKRRIAAGEYQLDASAIADAMFSRADATVAGEHRSEVLEPGEGDGVPRGVDEL